MVCKSFLPSLLLERLDGWCCGRGQKFLGNFQLGAISGDTGLPDSSIT